MKSALTLSLLLCLAAVDVGAQQSDKGQPALKVRSTLVEVPILVKSKGGEVVFQLMAETSCSPTMAYRSTSHSVRTPTRSRWRWQSLLKQAEPEQCEGIDIISRAPREVSPSHCIDPQNRWAATK